MHATTKPATLGVLLCGVGAVVQFADVSDIAKVLVVVILQLVGAPIGAHMLGRAVGGK
jgi:multicomponent Na+:H+ antiporter subunit G